jgi:outer membrane receptor protein involved in Fe transport
MILRVLALALVLAFPASAQVNDGSVEGVVTDSSGAVIPGAAVTVRNPNTSATHAATTDDRGLFRFLILPVGTYELVVEHPGFATLVQKNVVVTPGCRINFPLSLRLARREERVVVSGETPLLESTKSQVSFTVDQRLVASLPVNGRNFMDFVTLVPGVTAASGVNFEGQRGLNLMLVDGADDHNTFYGILMGVSPTPYQFSQESVREFQVNVNSYSAELGRAGAGIINTVTKSGTNEFHGNLFWYFRDRGLNATDLISKNVGEPKEPLHVHQFGGTVGGPIRKDRLFFFVSYDGQRRKERNETFLNLPSGFALSSNTTVAAFQQRALDYLAPRSAPWLRRYDQDILFAKLDWQIRSFQRLSGRWNRHRFGGSNLEASGAQNSFEHTGASGMNDDTLAVSLTSTLSPSMVNVLRFGYVHSNQFGRSNSSNPEAQVFESGQLVLTIGRSPVSPRDVASRRSELSDTLSFGRGRHAFKVGLNVLVDRVTFGTAINFSGSYRFNSLESLGRSLSGAPAPITGERYVQAFSGEGTPGVRVHPNFVDFAGFIQDEWHARPNLTFNLGLRYDVEVFATLIVKNPSSALAAAVIDTSLIHTDKNNFAPRLGLAWTPLRNGRLVVRAGYGFFYARTAAGHITRPFILNGVTVQTRTFAAGTSVAALIPAYPNTICGVPDPSGISPTCPTPTTAAEIIMPFSRDYVQPLVQQGSFGLEFLLQKDMALLVSFLAVKGTHLHRYRDVNLGNPVPMTIGIAGTSTVLTLSRFPGAAGSPTRPITGFDRILLFESAGNSVYHALAAQLNKRFSHNFQLQASYTLSKALDDNSNITPLNPGPGDGQLLSDSSNPGLDRGPSPSDRLHRFVLNGIWELNYAGRLPTLARTILSDWELSGILTAQSGNAYSGMVNFDLNNDGNAATDRTPGLGRNTFRLPASATLDPRLTRNMRFTDRVRLQFIWEAFNVFNRANISGVRTTQFSRSTSAAACGVAGTPCLVPQTNFSTPSATLGPRIMQFALKLLF